MHLFNTRNNGMHYRYIKRAMKITSTKICSIIVGFIWWISIKSDFIIFTVNNKSSRI